MTNYWKKMKLEPSDVTKNGREKRKEAYEKAHKIREFEIGLFWQRATYYWAFILAAFTAHFALLGLLFSTFSESENKSFSIPNLYRLPGLSLFALAVTAFFCYFFSLCWVLMNKGSKYWQKNWENHINELEQEFSGDLYKVTPNTECKDEFCCCPFSLKAYDYSVSKITMITSIALMIVSLFMFVFYFGLIVLRSMKGIVLNFEYCECMRWKIGIILLLCGFLLSFCIFSSAKGNISRKTKNDKWINLDDLTSDDF